MAKFFKTTKTGQNLYLNTEHIVSVSFAKPEAELVDSAGGGAMETANITMVGSARPVTITDPTEMASLRELLDSNLVT